MKKIIFVKGSQQNYCFICLILPYKLTSTFGLVSMFTFIHNLSLTGTAYPSGAPEFTSSCSILSFLLFGHCIVCSSNYNLWSSLWYIYLHNFLSCISWFSIWLDASHSKNISYLKMKARIHVCKYIKKFNFRRNQLLFVYFYLTV
jgi:hypothetical protein